ncbi:MAG: GTP-binding protein [Pseudomonadota bacterium]
MSKYTDHKSAFRQVPILLLTGFLGSGKTTLLNFLVKQPAFARTLVLINEFGEIGLDHDLVTHSTDGVVVEMSSGCLCCTIRGDLAGTLRSAAGRFGYKGRLMFDRVVIESTGLADPAPIVHTLMSHSDLVTQFRLDGVVATVDAVNGGGTLDAQIESVKQAAVADRLLLTKTDIVDADTLRDIQQRLKALNPGAPQVVSSHGRVDPELLFGAGLYDPKTRSPDVQRWLQAESYADASGHSHEHGHGPHGHHHHDVNRHDARIKAFCMTLDEPVERDVLSVWLRLLLQFRGADLLRVKGIVNVVGADGPVVVHGVQHVFHPAVTLEAWPSEDRRTRMVFITRDIDESLLRETLGVVLDGKTRQVLDAKLEQKVLV